MNQLGSWAHSRDRGSDTKTVEFADSDTKTVFLLGRGRPTVG